MNAGRRLKGEGETGPLQGGAWAAVGNVAASVHSLGRESCFHRPGSAHFSLFCEFKKLEK